jgi:hypothetical protein
LPEVAAPDALEARLLLAFFDAIGALIALYFLVD